MDGPTVSGFLAYVASVMPPLVWILGYLFVVHLARFAMNARAGMKPMYRPVEGGPKKVDFMHSTPVWASLGYTWSGRHRAAGDGVLSALVWINRALWVGFVVLLAAVIMGWVQQ